MQAPRLAAVAAADHCDVIGPLQVAQQRLTVRRRRDAVLRVACPPGGQDFERLLAVRGRARERFEAQEHLGQESVVFEGRYRLGEEPGARARGRQAVVEAAVGGAQVVAGPAGEGLSALQPTALRGTS